MITDLRAYYRRHDDYSRYTLADKRRVREIGHLYRSLHRFIGRRILDIGCGGGILGFVVTKDRHEYVGIDLDPDMIAAAKGTVGSLTRQASFVWGDATRRKMPGKFDTFTSLGNGLCHLSTQQFASILDNVRRNLRPSSTFIVDYRDVVEMLYSGAWGTRYVETRKGRRLISETEAGDFEEGVLQLRSNSPGIKGTLSFTHAIWSPFIMQPIMEAHGWRLVRRKARHKWHGWVEVYQRRSSGKLQS